MLDIIVVIVWAIVGITNLIFGLTNRLTYGCAWLCLMAYLIADVVK